jgi:NitT/TauT family transport system ATP-binding protein
MSHVALASPPPAGPPLSGDALVSLRGIGKSFNNGTIALSGLNLDIHDGEFLSLLGPSGCGKSTVLRLIAKLAAPSGGTIDMRGDAELGFVFQEPTLMPWSSVFNNVYLPLRVRGVSRAEAKPRVEEALEQVGLSAFANSYPRELSGGMKMRVSIARALVMRPALLLMDEPFAALDEITRTRLNDDLIRLQAKLRSTIVFVTHSVYESVYLSSRIVVMAARPGRVVADITIDEPQPRGEDFRLCSFYAERCRETSAALTAAMGANEMRHD